MSILTKREERGDCNAIWRPEGFRELLLRCMGSVVVLVDVIASRMFPNILGS